MAATWIRPSTSEGRNWLTFASVCGSGTRGRRYVQRVGRPYNNPSTPVPPKKKWSLHIVPGHTCRKELSFRVGARSTTNSATAHRPRNKTTQKPGTRTEREQGKKPKTPQGKTGPGQKEDQRQGAGEQDRRSQQGQGGSQTPVSLFTFRGVRSLCRRPSRETPSCVLNADTAIGHSRCERRHGGSSHAL